MEEGKEGGGLKRRRNRRRTCFMSSEREGGRIIVGLVPVVLQPAMLT